VKNNQLIPLGEMLNAVSEIGLSVEALSVVTKRIVREASDNPSVRRAGMVRAYHAEKELKSSLNVLRTVMSGVKRQTQNLMSPSAHLPP
jgi:hypothetical protein